MIQHLHTPQVRPGTRARLLVIAGAMIVIGGAGPRPSAAQLPVPDRPVLPAEADTNNAQSYMTFGASRLASNPREAAAAFYWAHQIDPTSADALYGQFVAHHLSEPRRLLRYWREERRVLRSPEIQAIDSLYFRALTLDPFLDRVHEAMMLRTVLRTWMREELARERGGFSVTEDLVDQWINSYMLRAGPEVRAMDARAGRRYGDALRLYERALDGRKRKSLLRTERSRIYYAIGDMESARTEMEMALEEMRREDEEDLVYLYESKALLEHGIAVLHERAGNAEAAREAYGRALQEDLSFFPAHGRLGMLAAAEGDTAAALASFDLAVQVAPRDPAFRQTYGYLLMRTGDFDNAAEQLTTAIQVGPYYPESYLVLGLLREQQGRLTDALEAYQGFVQRAARHDQRLAMVRQRVEVLEVVTATPAQP